MSVYTDLRDVADSLINEFGYAVTVKTPTNTGTAYAPTVSWASATVTGVKLRLRKSEIDGSLVQDGDVFFLLKGQATLNTNCRLTVDGSEYQIIAIEDVAPGGVNVIRKVQARK